MLGDGAKRSVGLAGCGPLTVCRTGITPALQRDHLAGGPRRRAPQRRARRPPPDMPTPPTEVEGVGEEA